MNKGIKGRALKNRILNIGHRVQANQQRENENDCSLIVDNRFSSLVKGCFICLSNYMQKGFPLKRGI